MKATFIYMRLWPNEYSENKICDETVWNSFTNVLGEQVRWDMSGVHISKFENDSN